MNIRVKAPWSEEQIAELKKWQASKEVHPFTSAEHAVLLPSKEGWVAKEGGPVVEDWAWDFMLDGSFRERVEDNLKKVFEEPLHPDSKVEVIETAKTPKLRFRNGNKRKL